MRNILLFLCTVFLLFACSPDKEELILEISESELLFSADEETKYFNIQSNDSWVIDQVPDWLSVDLRNGEGNRRIAVKADANPNEEVRSVTLKITSNNKSKDLKIKQGGKNVTLSLSESELVFPAEPTSEGLKFDINSNEAWTIANIPEWCTFSADKGSGNTTISVSVEKNYIDTKREVTLLIKAGSKSVNLVLTQEALNIELSFSNLDLTTWYDSPVIVMNFYNESSLQAIMIRSNTKWTVKNNSDWSIINRESGNGNELITVDVAENKSKTARQNEVIISAGTKSIKIIVQQSGIIDVPDNNPYQINMRDNAPRIGHELIKKQVEYVDPGKSGENIHWNFSKLEVFNNEYKVSYIEPPIYGKSMYVMGNEFFDISQTPVNSLVICIEHNTMYYFQIKDNQLHATGHENPSVRLHYNPRVISQIYPMYYGHYSKHYFESEGLYSSTVEVGTKGYMELEADGYGSITLPLGTYSNVIRIKTVKTFTDKTSQLDGVKEYTTYQWYVKGYRYPVFETHRNINKNDNSEIFSTAFYFSPKDHTYLTRTKKVILSNQKALIKNVNTYGKLFQIESLFPIIQTKRK